MRPMSIRTMSGLFTKDIQLIHVLYLFSPSTRMFDGIRVSAVGLDRVHVAIADNQARMGWRVSLFMTGHCRRMRKN